MATQNSSSKLSSIQEFMGKSISCRKPFKFPHLNILRNPFYKRNTNLIPKSGRIYRGAGFMWAATAYCLTDPWPITFFRRFPLNYLLWGLAVEINCFLIVSYQKRALIIHPYTCRLLGLRAMDIIGEVTALERQYKWIQKGIYIKSNWTSTTPSHHFLMSSCVDVVLHWELAHVMKASVAWKLFWRIFFAFGLKRWGKVTSSKAF